MGIEVCYSIVGAPAVSVSIDSIIENEIGKDIKVFGHELQFSKIGILTTKIVKHAKTSI